MAAPTTPQPPSLAQLFRDSLMILRERIWYFITVVVIGLTFGLILTYMTEPVYQAHCRLYVDIAPPKVLKDIESVVAVDAQNKEYINTLVKLLRGRALSRDVAAALFKDRPDYEAEFADEEDPPGEVIQELLNVQVVRNSRLIDIHVQHPHPELAKDLANLLAGTFIQENLSQRLAATVEALDWLEGQSETYKVKLETSETTLQEYRESTRSVSLEDKQNIVVGKLTDLNKALTVASTRRIETENEWKKVAETDNLISIPSIAEDLIVQNLHQQYLDKQIEIAALKDRYKFKHPDMMTALKLQFEIERRLQKSCELVAKAIENKYLIAKSQEAGIEAALNAHENIALDLDKLLSEYNQLKRNVEMDQQLYSSIMIRVKETGIAQKLEAHNIRISDPAVTPRDPVKPNKVLNLILSLFWSALAGLAIAFVAHHGDDRLRRVDDIQTSLHCPVMGVIPRIRRGSDREKAGIMLKENDSAAAESFRIIRANLLANREEGKGRVILVTSAQGNAGKSFICTNLAQAFAQNNLRTLLIDADLRRPTQHKHFDVPIEPGLADYLNDNKALEEVLRQDEQENLTQVFSGVPPTNPAEALGSKKMQAFLKEMTAQHDIVLLDLPPVIGISDVLALLPQVDEVLFVVNFNSSRRRMVLSALEKLREQAAEVGCVLNSADASKDHHYYYGAYGSSNAYYSNE